MIKIITDREILIPYYQIELVFDNHLCEYIDLSIQTPFTEKIVSILQKGLVKESMEIVDFDFGEDALNFSEWFHRGYISSSEYEFISKCFNAQTDRNDMSDWEINFYQEIYDNLESIGHHEKATLLNVNLYYYDESHNKYDCRIEN